MHRTILARLAGLALLAAALLLLPATPARAQAAVTVATTTTPGVVEVMATGFDADEDLTAWVTGPSEQVQAVEGQAADGDGAASFTLRIPRHFEAGRWAITVHGLDSGAEAIGTFTVAARGPDLTLTVSPASGAPGTTFAFSGAGFDADETVSYWLTGPAGATYEGGDVVADGDGAVSFSHTVGGAAARPGVWAMSAYGQGSDRLAVAIFTIN